MRRLGSTAVVLFAAALGPFTASAEQTARTPGPQTIGLALTSWRHALYETDYAKEECPDGLQLEESKQYAAMTNLDEHRRTVGGNKGTRGPIGETADNNPLDVVDAVPFREYKSTRGFGINLDGTADGRATAKTCQHQKFVSPDGEKVDNQIQRVIGCVQGYRTGGQMAEFQADEFVTRATNRILLEVAGVDDEQNDPSVEISVYKGLDRLVKAVNGNFVPHTIHRVDDRFEKHTARTRGKIVDGVLISDPIPEIYLSTSREAKIGDRVMKDLTFRIKLTGVEGQGYFAGYERYQNWYLMHSKLVVSDVGLYSSSGIYKALRRFADGFPDASGQCEYISSAWKVTAVRAMIVHPNKQPRVSETEGSTRVASARE